MTHYICSIPSVLLSTSTYVNQDVLKSFRYWKEDLIRSDIGTMSPAPGYGVPVFAIHFENEDEFVAWYFLTAAARDSEYNALDTLQQGETGETGPRGLRGLQGEAGPQGIQGLVGPQGETGGIGLTGPKGDTGDTGPQGEQGGQGIQGDSGSPGRDGINGREVTLRNSGDTIQWQYVGDEEWTNLTALDALVGPQGEPGVQGIAGLIGPQGIQGLQGEQGIQGEAGTDLSVLIPEEGGPYGLQNIRGTIIAVEIRL